MKKIFTAIILFTGFLYATETLPEKDTSSPISYRYVKLSDQWVLFPGLGLGYRSHTEKHGFDIDLTAYSYWTWNNGFCLYGKGHYLLYHPKKHLYLGIGAGVIGGWLDYRFSGIFGSGMFGDGFFIKPTLEGILGYEWNLEKTPLFIQLEAGVSYGHIPFYPALSFGVGF